MKLQGLTNIFLKRFFIRKLRWILRGHRYLRKTGSNGKIYTIMHSVADTKFKSNKFYSKKIFGAGVLNAGLVVRQYLIARLVVGTKLSSALLFVFGKKNAYFTYPLPPEWREPIERSGIKISRCWLSIVWNCYVLFFLIFGILSIFKKILMGFRNIVHTKTIYKNYAYFEGLSANNISSGDNDHTVIDWYCQWPERFSDLDAICHSVNKASASQNKNISIVRMSQAIPSINKFSLLIRFISWGMSAIFLATIDWLRGRWWHAFLLRESSLAALARLHNARYLARDYLIHNSNWVYRPLWTYEAETKGSRIIFYFYSISCGEGFKRKDGYPPLYFGFKTMSWPNYLVWDEHQANSVRKAVGDTAKISMVGPIWFSSSVAKIPRLPSKTIAVFDVQPMRNAFYQIFGIDFDYYIIHTAQSFLTDIYNITQAHQSTLVLKRKREMGRIIHPKYRRLVSYLETLPHCIQLNSEISAYDLIKESDVVISMPFTSAALIGKELNKPSIYYDPHGFIQKDDCSARDIPVLQGPQELKKWFETLL